MLPVPRTDKKTVVYIIDRVDTLGRLARLIKRRKESQAKAKRRIGLNRKHYSLKARKHNKSSSRRQKVM